MTTPTITERMRVVLDFVASEDGYGSQRRTVASLCGLDAAHALTILTTLERDGYLCHNTPTTGKVHPNLWWPTRLGLDTAWPGANRPAWDPTATFRVERYSAAWGGFRNDDLTPTGLTIDTARRTAATGSLLLARHRVVNEATGEVIATFRFGKEIRG